MVKKNPEEMTASQINRRIDRLDELSSKLTDEFIAAGRGNERPSEIIKKADPLAVRFRSIFDERAALQIEIAMRYGTPAPSRLPARGFGPRKGVKRGKT